MSFDVETSGRANKFYMCGVIDTDGVYKAYYDKKEFLEYLLKLNLKNTLVFATNLNFDYSSISEGTNLNNRCTFVINAGHFIMVEVNGSYQYIKLLDSMNYGGLSVEKMGKILNLPKGKKPKALGKIPKNKRDKKELEDYNRRDCEITRDFMILIQDTLNLIGGELKLTISSCALDLFRRKFLKFELMRENISLGFDVKKNIFEAYFGGRVEAVGRGKIEDYNYFDVNSLYPSVMLKDYPNPNSCVFIDENDYQIDYLNYEGVSYFELQIPYSQYPVLPFRMKNKLCFPYGKIKGFYTHYEIRYARDYYKKYNLDFKILKMNQTLYYTEMIPIFKEYVEDLYTQRNHYKSLGSPYEVCFKLLLNTLYGKWGYRYVAKTKFFTNLSDKEMCKLIDEYEENEIYVNDIGEGYAQSVTDFDGVYSFPIFAVYTTSYARVKLHTLIDETNPIYYDTDSIITKSFMKDSRELGDLKLEKSIKTGVIIKPKMYFLDEDLKMKGVPIPKNIRDKIRLKRKILNKDFIHYQKFTKIKEGIRSNRKVNSVYVMQKYVSLNDDKRNWEGREFNPLEFQLSKPVKINCDEIEVKEK